MPIRPPAFDRLVESIARLPGIGPRSATRMALWLLDRPSSVAEEIARSLVQDRAAIRRCGACGQYSEEETCAICSDPGRDRSLLCVVEEAVDVWSFERTGRYKGLYHVLGGALSPLDGIGPDELAIAPLLERVRDAHLPFEEIILATDPDTEGNATAYYIADLLKGLPQRVSRLAHGLPVGGELAYSDEATLGEALKGRRDFLTGV